MNDENNGASDDALTPEESDAQAASSGGDVPQGDVPLKPEEGGEAVQADEVAGEAAAMAEDDQSSASQEDQASEPAPAKASQPAKPSRPRDRSQPLEEVSEEEEEPNTEKDWYILKVASNRENSVCDALKRRIRIAGLEDYFGDIIIPTEDIVEYKNGKRKTTKRKLYPGYIVAHMAINDDTWFLVRETPGIGDFTGAAGKPSPMSPQEIERVLPRERGERPTGEDVKVEISFKVGDRVRITEGNFINFEGDVESINEANARVTVVISIFNRPTPVEFEYWQIEAV